MSITIRLVGGPADGRVMPVIGDQVPPLYLIPMPPPLTEFLSDSTAGPAPIPVAEYEPIFKSGWPSRADDGAYFYRHRPTPVTPEARRALEEARRMAQAAEERRAAELDEAWQEIRRERPHFPSEWRGLFS
ncbi:hypothetical protein CFC35_05855 [Streptomyces sp. FBKL.4005]|uniref:Uncharacterized protein n=1 Tax=Streptomyces tricolor TaxID=68277 RepID=A0ABS9JHM3_9ACTN|nr:MULTISPECIES: hypothetical protein [Streptomyces]MCG0065048.1 hypothetical protein [Streptomyces tricolor]OYP14089.1 hypothetical protein CFC35_05855 [Streptomyces sp. FBKL.4005]